MSYPETIKADLTSNPFMRNPIPEYQRLRESGDLVCLKLPFIGKTWAATSYESVNAVLKDQATFVREPRNAGLSNDQVVRWWMPGFVKAMMTSMIARDEPDHRRLRSLVEKAFVKQNVETLRERIASIANRHLEQMEKQAGTSGDVDLIQNFARPIPFVVICELLGVPEGDRHILEKHMGPLSSVRSAWGVFRALPGIKKVLNYFREQFELCRRNPRPGLVSDLVHVEQEGDRLSEDELLSMVVLLFFAGHETTVHLISHCVLTLEMHPEAKQQLRNDWTMLETAVEEIHRFASPVQMTKPRYLSKDVELFGRHLKKGQSMIAFLAGANYDPSKFAEPEQLRLERSPNPHLGFGTGIHVCQGLKLARAETQVAIRALYETFPDLKLSQTYEQIRWNRRIGIRGMKALPIQLGNSAEGFRPELARRSA